MKPDIDKIAKQHGYEVERENKHKIYKGPNGGTLVIPSTPSDKDWEQNALTTLARNLGMPRKDLLHVDRKPLRALRPHTPLPKHENPAARTKDAAAIIGELKSFLKEHMRRAAINLAFQHDYARTEQERFDATADAVLQMARNLRSDRHHAPVLFDCDAVFCMKLGGSGEGYDCVEFRMPVVDGTFVLYLDPACGEIHVDVPWTCEDGRRYEPAAYAGDWF